MRGMEKGDARTSFYNTSSRSGQISSVGCQRGHDTSYESPEQVGLDLKQPGPWLWLLNRPCIAFGDKARKQGMCSNMANKKEMTSLQNKVLNL